MKWIAVICLALLVSCSEGKHESGERVEVGQFVYVDAYECYHVSLDCPTLSDKGETKYERMAGRQGVQFVDTCKIREIQHFCPRCVNDEAYKRLSQIIERNSTMPGVETTSVW